MAKLTYKIENRVGRNRMGPVTVALFLAVLLTAGCSGPTPIAPIPQPSSPPKSAPVPVPPSAAQATVLPPTPVPSSPTGQVLGATPASTCQAGALTPAQTEGPYFKAGAPMRSSLLEPSMAGTKLILSGKVLTPDCAPVVDARMDFWQADDNGQYDNKGYKLRGYLLTDKGGHFVLETIVPGLYPGRTRHIHVKIQVPNGATLTTQLYFPDEPRNASDSIFDPRLLMQMGGSQDGKSASFMFTLPVQ